MEAGGTAMRLPAYQAAVEQYRAAIAIHPETLDAWLQLGRAEELAGRSDLAESTYRLLIERARRAGRAADEAAALVRLAELAGRDLAAAAPDELLEEAVTAAMEVGDPGVALEARLAEAQVDAYRGSLARARAGAEAAHRQARRIGRADLVARSLNLRAFASQGAGRWAEALSLARQAEVAYEALGERLMVLDSTGYETAALVFLGRWRDALRRVRRGLIEAERLDNPWAVSNLSLVEAWALRDGGRLDEALASSTRGVAAARAAGFTPLEVLNGVIAGRCRRELGDAAGAIETHLGLASTAEALDGVAYQAVAEELCADLAALGDWRAAADWAGRWVARWGEMQMFGHLALWAVADARLWAGSSFSMPALAETDRYRVVRLRTKSVLAAHAGDRAGAEEALALALELAERLGLVVEAREISGGGG